MRIRKIRERQKITQKRFAEILCVSQPTVCAWESGQANPTADKIPDIAKALGCEINDLFDAEK